MKPDQTTVRLATDETLNFFDLEVPHASPTGAQILEAANATQGDTLLLQRLPSGDLEMISLSDIPDLKASIEFVLSLGDHSYSTTVDDIEIVWAARHISGETLRKLAKVPDMMHLFLQRSDEGLQVIESATVVDLAHPRVEKFVTKPKIWKLRVQGVTLEFTTPYVKVGEALRQAGFDPTKAWDIFLLVAGQPKQKVDVNFVVDLTTPGIERIRLMQRNVDNGEASKPQLLREFRLLDVDEAHLDATGLRWETINCDQRRWLIIHDYPLLPGYNPDKVRLALDIPKDYPQAQLDMFYCDPAVTRCDGVVIPKTQIAVVIQGVQFQGWSRHRNSASPWDPFSDNVATQLALVEHSLAREFGE